MVATVVPLVIAAAIATIVFASRKTPVAAFTLAFVTGITLLIAFPTLVPIGGPLSFIFLLTITVVGCFIIALAFGHKKTPTGVALIIGASLITWAVFRFLPNSPMAFQHLAAHLNKAGAELWKGLAAFPHDLFSKVAKLPPSK